MITKFDKKPHCTGSIIHPRFALSAGHCFADDALGLVKLEHLQLYFGVSDMTEQLLSKTAPPYSVFGIERRTIKRIINHPGYSYPSAYNDITIIGMCFYSLSQFVNLQA